MHEQGIFKLFFCDFPCAATVKLSEDLVRRLLNIMQQ
jgi:hypothetical protein